MGKTWQVSLPLLILAVALQSSISPQIRFGGGSPDFVLVLVLLWASRNELETGLTWAIIGGVLQDLLSVVPAGASALGMVIPVYIVHLLRGNVYRVGFILMIGVVFGSTLFKELVVALVASLIGYRTDYGILFEFVMLPTAAYNIAFLAIAYALLKRTEVTQSRRDAHPYMNKGRNS